MNPFAKYGIEHLSASQCNLFTSSPAMYVMERLLKLRSPVGAAAHRGTAVEAGIAHGLMNGAPLKECQEVAQKEFSRLTALSADPRLDKESAALAGMVDEGLKELLPYGKPTSAQGAIKYHVEGLAVPLIGFYDFAWEQHGILTDLKTTHALPSKISTNHARQVALYRASLGDNMDARITYVTPKKAATYHLENVREHVSALEKIALTIQRFLMISDDPHYLASIIVPDVDSFYFSDPKARQNAFDVWGL